MIGTNDTATASGTGTGTGGGGGGFKKGGFKSSFATVKGPVAQAAPAKKNVLGDDEEDEQGQATEEMSAHTKPPQGMDENVNAESDTDEEYADTASGGYYDPRKPTGCFDGCSGLSLAAAS